MGVVHGHARPTIGAHPHPEHHALQLGLAHLCRHRRGGRIGVGVCIEGDEGAVVIAAVEQALLGIEQVALAVFGADRQAHQTLDDLGVVPLGALDAQRAIAVERARVVIDHEVRRVGVGIDFGAALHEPCRGKAPVLQALQRLGLGRAPGRLGERAARGQGPARARRGKLPGGRGSGGNGARKAQIHRADGGLGAGVDGDVHLRQRCRRG